jgi:PIN domain nuclease of toxin-antitoxin system
VNLLLDTHIWLWALLEPERLPRAAADAIAADGNRCWLSSLSIWEALMLAERRRIEIDAGGESWIREALARWPLEIADVGAEVVFASRRLATHHADPVDRFLLATAQVFDLTLVTADRLLEGVPGARVLPLRPARAGRRKAARSRRP